MILIIIAYISITLYEWWYLNKKSRKKRTRSLVLGSAAGMFLCLCILYLGKGRWTVGEMLEGIFSPIDHWMKAGR
ncbi:hypothetical protein BK138_34300 [Paenibacillus rhizosphaerae]|uniref:Uncharacterized protein n=1 Tax=Paenibacillus rhizosphaerae TaxID=297318 RepID=A0A1R1DYR8_9BACL|nr:hypothetical protein BK138_34300 [Paenibacillus rhizosphaerae]